MAYVHKQPRIRKFSGSDISAELEIKDTTESTTSASFLYLLLSIGSDCQLDTSIYDFISHTFRSWVVIFHLRRPLTFLSLILYDTPGLAPHMNVLFGGPSNFPVGFLNRDTPLNA